MPNEMIKPSGPYEVGKLDRRIHPITKERIFTRNERLRVERVTSSLYWVKLIGYYAVLYSFLAFFTYWYFVFLYINVAGTNSPVIRKLPGLSSAPGEVEKDYKVIRYNMKNLDEIQPLVQKIEQTIDKFGLSAQMRLRECNLDTFWGYRTGSPCVILKLNIARGFEAITYDEATSLPPDVTDALYGYVLELPSDQRRNRIWISCTYAVTNDYRTVVYIPHQFFEAEGMFDEEYLFISEGNDSEVANLERQSLQRIIGVKFDKIIRNKDNRIKCTVWAKNIPYELASVTYVINIKSNQE